MMATKDILIRTTTRHKTVRKNLDEDDMCYLLSGEKDIIHETAHSRIPKQNQENRRLSW